MQKSFSSVSNSSDLCLFTVLQAAYVLFRDDDGMKLPYFIGIAGLVCAMFAICIPHLSALGIWLGFSTVLSLVYIVIAFVLSVKDGNLSFYFHSLFMLDEPEANSHTNLPPCINRYKITTS